MKTLVDGNSEFEVEFTWFKRHNLRSSVEAFLGLLKHKEVCYFPNPGNAGDALIALGTYQALKRSGVGYRMTPRDANVHGEIVVMGGGGAFVPLYSHFSDALEHFYGQARMLVILPHTIRGNIDILGKLGGNCHIFCREPESYMHVLQHAPNANVYLSHDMAFHIEAEDFLFNNKSKIEFSNRFKGQLNVSKVDVSRISQAEVVYFTRGDGERKNYIDGDMLDISEIFKFGEYPSQAECSSWCFLEAIRLAKEIQTDRLHVGIGAALLNRKCTLFDNSYGKNRNVYDHSLRNLSADLSFVK